MLRFIKGVVLKIGFVRSLFYKFLPNGIYVFNYHRIYSEEIKNTIFDESVISCTKKELEAQIIELKENFDVIHPSELENTLKKPSKSKVALITFDDGYIDNYVNAYPILKKHAVSAIFFVPTAYINSLEVPWWDKLAFVVRAGWDSKKIYLKGINHFSSDKTVKQVISTLSRTAKQQKEQQTSKFIDDIASENGIDTDSISHVRLFMNWDELKEVSSNGIVIGSHSVNHDILTTLDQEKCNEEFRESKARLDESTEKETVFFAYPVGDASHFADSMANALKEEGYTHAFNNMRGINESQSNKYSLNRFSVNQCSIIEVLFDYFVRKS
jgi:peptidoglycan/xylan/chitin deacetylase (PgdA/CDA1 family)